MINSLQQRSQDGQAGAAVCYAVGQNSSQYTAEEEQESQYSFEIWPYQGGDSSGGQLDDILPYDFCECSTVGKNLHQNYETDSAIFQCDQCGRPSL